ncbi:Uu.00g126750.m01.CDS01 [Anthostomella pinea]|uniref:Uu.00g126750.m01.CDS01 n=1 Tax=Anthostomella pinea TaxID=933095 RepID=A0AAI8YHU5_9PEZI|nr:Uu.00g126750.m01.CDS01 [Anthostomella pinea]
MSLPAPAPPLLLTKRLTAFLRANLTPQIHTALLTTLSGKLLAHASPHSIATLRTQCTVSASLWALYSAPSTSANIAEALPPQQSSSPARGEPTSSAITVQLTGAVVVIRRLRCGLLFVCMGPAAEGAEHGGQGQGQQQQQQGRPMQTPQPDTEAQPEPLGSPSEVASVASAGAATTASIATTASAGASAVVAMRRQAEELARWLNDKLGSLGVPEEEMGGIETR